MAPNSVVQTGVKFFGWLNRTAQPSPIPFVKIDGAVCSLGEEVGCGVVDTDAQWGTPFSIWSPRYRGGAPGPQWPASGLGQRFSGIARARNHIPKGVRPRRISFPRGPHAEAAFSWVTTATSHTGCSHGRRLPARHRRRRGSFP